MKSGDPRYLKVLGKMTRRERTGMVGRRASRLNPLESANAWHSLAEYLQRAENECEADYPKFNDLIATILGISMGQRAKTKRAKDWTPIGKSPSEIVNFMLVKCEEEP